ncbi:MAG: glycine/sarcosine/betaine reductase selenoprotein B family protein [Pseudomonadota bacterium]|nr:glycine/betaine/sarcosine/D-proline family reductase selenoprotein B [Pseudomonadota bacterium]MBU2234866.1 glycine/betaine/sarcosine/D-proline family reductase selenoprotein B [Pseudomonadota bacterium]MBU2252866.1 glycine/betaine/sarcosine/D-proline family reductase selenoprotein B [Pseudomonadota bacterium]MBU3932422.1 glycine/betaine/sarcosine/D-proline family reductase selenoprotein B [Pseudomonadota bacterium]MBU4074862.1 glycine/betaine/sarcosine/D-proline family reductase selenoprote
MKYLKYVDVTRAMFPDQPPYQWTENVSAPWTPITKPLSESRVALISSGGIYRKDQPPFKPDKNDLTFREIPADTDAGDLRISHDYYEHSDAEKDVNCVFPIERMRELAADGFIGSLPEIHFTFMGRIFRKTQLLNEMIPGLIARLKALGVDLAFLVPA